MSPAVQVSTEPLHVPSSKLAVSAFQRAQVVAASRPPALAPPPPPPAFEFPPAPPPLEPPPLLVPPLAVPEAFVPPCGKVDPPTLPLPEVAGLPALDVAPPPPAMLPCPGAPPEPEFSELEQAHALSAQIAEIAQIFGNEPEDARAFILFRCRKSRATDQLR